jgi:hypothetical protein
MSHEAPDSRRRRQSGPAYNERRRAYRERNALAFKLARNLDIPLSTARVLASTNGMGHVSTSVNRPSN